MRQKIDSLEFNSNLSKFKFVKIRVGATKDYEIFHKIMKEK